MKVLVTGGSGFIGTNMVNFLIDKGFNVVNYDINKPKLESHIKFWTQVDICNKYELSKLIQSDNPDYIIHLAARTDLNERTNLSGYKVNIDGVRNIMEESSKLKSLKRIIVASSMLVCKLGYIPSSFDDYQPNSLYGESKVFTEKIVKEFSIDWVIVRPTSIWGPWFQEPYRNFYDLVLKGFYFNIPIDKASTKTYGFVENTCQQIYDLLLSDKEAVTRNYFYLGDKNPLNVTIWANKIRTINNQGPLITLPLFVFHILAKIGDFFQKFLKINNFPMNSFRFRNMTTDNIIIDLSRTFDFSNGGAVDNLDIEISKTLFWINNHKKQQK